MSRSIPTRRPIVRTSLAALLVGVLIAACSAGTPSRNELVEALKTSGVPADVARCAADAMMAEDSLSADQFAQIVERGPGGAPADDPERTDDPSDKVRAALAVCREDLPVATVPGTTVPGASTPPTLATTTTPPATTVPATADATETAPAAGSDADNDADSPGTDDTGPAFDSVPPTSEG